MRQLTSLIAISVFSLPLYAATPTETVAAFHEALASGKSEQAITLLSPKINIYESGHVERSRDEYAGHHLPADAAFAKVTKSKVLKQNERIDGNLAVVMQETETTGQFQGKNVHLFGTETALLEKQGDQWIIFHLHWSSRKSQ